MTKKSLYDILGIPEDAGEAGIRHAAALHLRILEADPSIEDRANRMAFVRQALDVLTDPVRRARYDDQRRVAAVDASPGPAVDGASSPRLGWVLGVALVVLAGVYAATARRPPMPASAMQARLDAGAAAARDDGDGDDPPGPAGEIATADQPAGPSAGTPAGSPAARADKLPAAVKPSYQVSVDAPDGELLKKLVWSVFGIVGQRGFGTGIMIDNEKLLTNCHVLAPNVRAGKMYAVNSVTHDHAEITSVAFLEHEDACLVKAPGLNGQAVAIGSTALLAKGDMAHNIGYANGQLIGSQGQFLGWMKRFGQEFIATSNYCDHGVSGGPLVDGEGRLIGLTTGGPVDRSRCYSLTVETVAALRFQSLKPIAEFPENYVSNMVRRAW